MTEQHWSQELFDQLSNSEDPADQELAMQMETARRGRMQLVNIKANRWARQQDLAERYPNAYQILSKKDMLMLEAPLPLVDGLFYTNSVIMLAGPGGVGKTAVVLAAVCAMQLQIPFLGLATTSAKTLYIAGEGQASIHRRLDAWAEANEVDPDTIDLDMMTGIRLTNEGLSELSRVVVENQYKLVIIDTVATVTALESENDNSEVSDFLQSIRHAVCDAVPGASVLLCHHVTTIRDKNGHATQQKMRGASAWRDNVDTVVMLRGEKGSFKLSTEETDGGKQKDAGSLSIHDLKLAQYGQSITVRTMTEVESVEKDNQVYDKVDIMSLDEEYSSKELQTHWNMERNNTGYDKVRLRALELGLIVKQPGHFGKYVRTAIEMKEIE